MSKKDMSKYDLTGEEQLEREEQAINEPMFAEMDKTVKKFFDYTNRIFSRDETIASIERDREYQNNPFN
jgi:hypothetical protein